jgi:hypothetical protein
MQQESSLFSLLFAPSLYPSPVSGRGKMEFGSLCCRRGTSKHHGAAVLPVGKGDVNYPNVKNVLFSHLPEGITRFGIMKYCNNVISAGLKWARVTVPVWILFVGAVVSGEGRYTFYTPQCLYTDSAMTALELANGIGIPNGYNPYIDHPLWAIKQKNGKLRFYYRSMLHQSYHEGGVADRSFFGTVVDNRSYIHEYTTSRRNPMSHRDTGVRWPKGVRTKRSGKPADQMEYVQNVYALSREELLGFVHIERTPKGLMVDRWHPERILDRLYAIGIAHSTDGGFTWRYCGDVVLPHWDRIGDTVIVTDGSVQTILSNIGGVPYLIVPDSTGRNMVQIYFNELPGPHDDNYPSAATAPLDSVVAYARRGFVNNGHWKKWAGGSWSADPLYGCGERVLPPEVAGCLYDTHADAVRCAATGEYLLTVTQTDNRSGPDSTVCSLLLFSSADGSSWRRVAELARSSRAIPVYSSFICEGAWSTIDDHEVGDDFYLLYAGRPVVKNGFDYAHPDLFMIRVNAGSGGEK